MSDIQTMLTVIHARLPDLHEHVWRNVGTFQEATLGLLFVIQWCERCGKEQLAEPPLSDRFSGVKPRPWWAFWRASA